MITNNEPKYYITNKERKPWSLAEGEGNKVYRKEVIYAGTFWAQDSKGARFNLTVDETDIDHWVKTHEAMLAAGVAVPVPLEHTSDPEKRRGTVTKLEKAINEKGLPSLYAHVEFVDAEAEKLAKSSDVSIFVPPEFEDGAGNEYSRPVRHIALTDYPIIPGLEPFTIAASFGEVDDMKLTDLASKLGVKLEDGDGDDVAATKITSAWSGLKKQLKEAKAAPSPTPTPTPAPSKKADDKKPIAAGFIKLAKTGREAEINSLVDSGKITPAVATELSEKFCSPTALQLSLSEDGESSDSFDDIISALKKNSKVIPTGEKSGSQSLRLSAEENPLIADAERRAKAAGTN